MLIKGVVSNLVIIQSPLSLADSACPSALPNELDSPSSEPSSYPSDDADSGEMFDDPFHGLEDTSGMLLRTVSFSRAIDETAKVILRRGSSQHLPYQSSEQFGK